MSDQNIIVIVSQMLGQSLCHIDTAMLATSAANGYRHVDPRVRLKSRHPTGEDISDVLEHLINHGLIL